MSIRFSFLISMNIFPILCDTYSIPGSLGTFSMNWKKEQWRRWWARFYNRLKLRLISIWDPFHKQIYPSIKTNKLIKCFVDWTLIIYFKGALKRNILHKLYILMWRFFGILFTSRSPLWIINFFIEALFVQIVLNTILNIGSWPYSIIS